MKVFVIGGSGNGKSAFAEKVAAKLGGKLIYVATMPVYSEEDLKVVERHHKLRAGRGFETLERPERITDIPDNKETVLLECVSTHVANFMFGNGFEELQKEPNVDWVKEIWKELEPVFHRDGNTVFVSAEVTKDGYSYGQTTDQYRKVLSLVNDKLAEAADVFVEVVYGIPVVLKGSLDFLNE